MAVMKSLLNPFIEEIGQRFGKELVSESMGVYLNKGLPVSDIPGLRNIAKSGPIEVDGRTISIEKWWEHSKNFVEHGDQGAGIEAIAIQDTANDILNTQQIKSNTLAFKNANPSAQLDSTAQIEIPNNFTVSRENLAPGIEGANIQSETAEALAFHQKGQAIQGDPGEGGLSTLSTIGKLEGQQKGFNLSAKEKAETVSRAYVEGKGLGTKIEEVPGKRGTRTEITADIENMPYKELHHIFGKSMGGKIIDNVWRLIDEGKATVDDLINLNYWAKAYGTGMGDFGTEAVNRVPHSKTHTFSRKFGIEMSSDEIAAMPEFDDINELTSYFRELLETRVKPMMGELDLQQGSYELLPNKMRLDVEKLKVAKEKASRDLTESYKAIYKKKMKNTPEPVKDAYQTYKWIQEELGVTEPELIEKAKKLDQARLAQDQQMDQVQKLLEVEENKAIQSAQSKQIKKERRGSPRSTTRRGQSEEYAANRIDPKEATEKQMLEALTPKSDAEKKKYIELLRSGKVKIEDLIYKDSKGKWKLRKITKALLDKAKAKK